VQVRSAAGAVVRARTAVVAAGAWPADPDPAEGWPSGVYGLVNPCDGVKVVFHGTGPECHPDRRDRAPEPGQPAQLQEYVRRWLPGRDAEALDPVSCTCTSTPTGEFVLDRTGPVVVAAGFSGHGFSSATAIGRVLVDLAVGAPVNAGPFARAAHSVLH
jgi:sarcosine oxidase